MMLTLLFGNFFAVGIYVGWAETNLSIQVFMKQTRSILGFDAIHFEIKIHPSTIQNYIQ